MRRPLHPGPWVTTLSSLDRHCYFSQIPELGVFLVGSPIGRVGVFTLYWTKDEGNPQPRYGFKLEYMLPLKQDDENMVAGVPPESRLAGVAVGPVQGTLNLGRLCPFFYFFNPRPNLLWSMSLLVLILDTRHVRSTNRPRSRRWRGTGVTSQKVACFAALH